MGDKSNQSGTFFCNNWSVLVWVNVTVLMQSPALFTAIVTRDQAGVIRLTQTKSNQHVALRQAKLI
ncbi:MAG TPA: hypothetical protein DHC76_07715 [Rhodobacteraceae bacterium]|nr:hypothetical protein [Paracoccaceae bacterium]